MKGRRVPPPAPTQFRPESIARIEPNTRIAVGVCQNSATGYWHTWFTLSGTDVSSAAVYETETEAEALANDMVAVFKNWDYKSNRSVQAFHALIDRGARESLMLPQDAVLPDDQVRSLLKDIPATGTDEPE